MSDITKISLVDLVTNIKNKSISCEEVTSAYINRINKSKKNENIIQWKEGLHWLQMLKKTIDGQNLSLLK